MERELEARPEGQGLGWLEGSGGSRHGAFAASAYLASLRWPLYRKTAARDCDLWSA
jgi:hypothetical protein